MRPDDVIHFLGPLLGPNPPVALNHQHWWEIVCITLPRVEEFRGRREIGVGHMSYTDPETGRTAKFYNRVEAVARVKQLNEELPEGVERYVVAHARRVVTLDEAPTDSEP